MKQILDEIKANDKIIISRHFRPDGDAIGSTKGLQRILKLTFPQKDIRLINEDYSDYLAFLGGEDAQQDDEFYKDALVIMIDTGTIDRSSNKKVELAKKLIKIDHHIDDKPYGDISWVEELRSSACEMIAHFYLTFKDELKIDSEAANYIYLGMVTDSGRFKYRDTSAETLRNAAAMLDFGFDTESMYAHLDLEDIKNLRFKSFVLSNIKLTENGVAYIYITKRIQKKFGITTEQASNAVSYLQSIKGSLIWLAFIDGPDGKIRVRLRSRFVTVQELATNYRGGGHACASGATLLKKSEIKLLLKDADARIKDYKDNNEGWI